MTTPQTSPGEDRSLEIEDLPASPTAQDLLDIRNKSYRSGTIGGFLSGGLVGLFAGAITTVLLSAAYWLPNQVQENREIGFYNGYRVAQNNALVVDLNNDGHADLLTSKGDGTYDILINQGNGNLLPLEKHVESQRMVRERVYDPQRKAIREEVMREKGEILKRAKQVYDGEGK